MVASNEQGLRLGDDVTLPVDTAATTTFGILGKKGRGKTHTAVVLAEGLIETGCPVCVLDPTGVWWGLRSSADGTAPGLPVVIFGGERADVELTEAGGALLAELLVEQRFPAVLDLSLLSKSARRRFATEFLETIYHRNREPLHLLIDEADEFAPQRTFAGVERLLGATEDAVRRGRVRGLGITLISQRPAALNKTVLSQIDTLLVLGMTAPQDITAIDAWVSQHADEDHARTIKASLPALPIGEGWVWSPEWLGVLSKVRIRARRTFDSSATPTAGQVRVQPQQWAHVDVTALADRLAHAAEHGAESEPHRLRDRVRQLERQLASATRPAPERIEIEVPIITSEQTAELASLVDRLDDLASSVAESAGRLAAAAGNARRPAAQDDETALATPTQPMSETTSVGESNGDLGRAERQILVVLAQHGRRTTTQIALLTRRSRKSGGYRNALSRLRTRGLIEGRGEVAITPAGRESLGGNWQPLPTGPALVEWWHGQLSRAERLILAELVKRWPDEMSLDEIADRTGYSRASGGFRNALSRLRSLELAHGRGALRAADTLGGAATE